MARPKKIVEEKAKEVVTQTPSKIVSVVFTIPTSFSYESVKVEISGVADNDELVAKYNELVAIFRPAQKPIPVKEPMKPYTVARAIPPADDEAGGAVIKEDVKDEETIRLQKQDIAALLADKHNFLCKGKTPKVISDKVFDITGLLLEESNYENIIDKLKV